MVLIFTFVALWHDLSFRLLAWGWLVSVFILPELLAAALLPQSKVRLHFPIGLSHRAHSSHDQYGRYAWYRHVCACGGALNVITMTAANLVGFVIGTDGILYMVNQIAGSFQGNVVQHLLFFDVAWNGPSNGSCCRSGLSLTRSKRSSILDRCMRMFVRGSAVDVRVSVRCSSRFVSFSSDAA